MTGPLWCVYLGASGGQPPPPRSISGKMMQSVSGIAPASAKRIKIRNLAYV